MTLAPSRSWGGRAAAVGVVVVVLNGVVLGACGSATVQPMVERAFPVAVAHRFGTTELSAAPRRVVALAPGDRDVLLALDIVPIGMPGVDDHGPLPAWTADRLADVRRRTGVATVPVEADTQPSGPDHVPTEGAPPDLVLAVTGSMYRTDYDEDAAVAPVVGPPPGHGGGTLPPGFYGDDHAPWQDGARLIGDAVGRPVAAERLVAGIEARFAAARARHPRLAGRTAICARLGTSSAPPVYAVPAGPRTPCSRFLAELGLNGVPALEPAPGESVREVTAAQVAAAHPDVVVLADDAEGDGAAAKQDIVRARLDPGQHTVGLGHPESDVLSAPTVLNLPLAVDTVADAVDRALR